MMTDKIFRQFKDKISTLMGENDFRVTQEIADLMRKLLNMKYFSGELQRAEIVEFFEQYEEIAAVRSLIDLSSRVAQYNAAKQIVLSKWEARGETLKAMPRQTLIKLFKMVKSRQIISDAVSNGEIVFEILEREAPMPSLKRFGLTPEDV